MAICVIAVVGEAPCQCFTVGGAPDHVARLDFLNLAFPFPGSANPGGNDKVLPCRVSVPSGSGPRLEGDIGAGKGRRILCGKQRVNTDIAGKIFGRPFDGRLRAGPGYRLRLFGLLPRPVPGPQKRLLKRLEKELKALLCISFFSPYDCSLRGFAGT